MARMRDKQKAKRITIPGMAGVEGRTAVAEGEHRVTVTNVTQEEGQAADYLKWEMSVDGGGKLYYNTSFSPAALWNLRSLLEALGQEVQDEESELDPEDLKGLPLMVNVEHELYEGKKQARIVDFWPAEDEAPAEAKKEEPKGKKKAEPKKEPDAPSADDIKGMSEDELADLIEEHNLDVELSDYRTLRKKAAAVIEAMDL